MQSQELLRYDLTGAKPFLKWAGGKSRMLKQMLPLLPPESFRERYYEPFLGGGAMFFSLRPQSAVLSDRLQEVVISFRVVRDNVDELKSRLRYYRRRHHEDAKTFYAMTRKTNPRGLDSVERAARLIYLNKTCYNGIYRVNSAWEFNVPMGVYKNPNILDSKTLDADSVALRRAAIKHLDYSSAVEKLGRGDFVYLDPPYSGQFTGYHKNGFGMEDQENLARVYRKLHDAGAHLMLSNGADERIRSLYQGFTRIHLEGRSVLSGKVKGRGKVEELLVINYDPKTGALT